MQIQKPYTNEQYAELAIYCNGNDAHIEDKGDYLESVKNEYTAEQLRAFRIAELKELLCNADYWGQKYIDGEYTEAEWEEKKAQRKAWRAEIRELEGQDGQDDNSVGDSDGN